MWTCEDSDSRSTMLDSAQAPSRESGSGSGEEVHGMCPSSEAASRFCTTYRGNIAMPLRWVMAIADAGVSALYTFIRNNPDEGEHS